MCGIAGILSLSPDRAPVPDELRAMAAQLIHRGPDDEGYHLDPAGRCGLAFRRLSIIDLAGGHQPLCNESQTVWLVFNGEIYNFRELRGELESRGHRFRSATDGEVIVHLYEECGTRCFERLEGMFAVAIWDQQRGELHLARDRLGKKPLVYAQHDGRLLFASEQKAILALPGIPRELDAQSIHRYLVFQYVPAPFAIFRGFRKLPPGTFATIRAGRPAAIEALTYWAPPPPNPGESRGKALTYEQALERLGRLLTRAVEKRLIADVPLGAFLSGGIDSSIVVGLMRRLGVSPLRTFSIGFADTRYDETRYARLVAGHFETEHTEFIVTPSAGDVLDTLAFHYDEPFADSSAIPTSYVARCTRQSVTVALTGDGGDECFGGYDRYRALALAGRLDFLPRPLRSLAARLAAALPRGRARSLGNRAHRFFAALPHEPARRYLSWVGVFGLDQLAAGYTADFRAAIDFDEPLRWFRGLFACGQGDNPSRANYTDVLSYLPGDLLTKVDIASMACGLECRAPLLDHELVEFALRLPPAWRFGRGGKRILRHWARDLLPAEILTRPKMGFGVPVGEWLRNELRQELHDLLFAPDSLCATVFEQRWLQSFVDAHQSARANHEHPLWSLYMLERWHRRWHA